MGSVMTRPSRRRGASPPRRSCDGREGFHPRSPRIVQAVPRGTCDVMDHSNTLPPWSIPILAEARGLMPLSEICLRIAIGAFVVGLAPFSLAIFYRYLGDISASDIALIIAMAPVVVAVASLFGGI